MVADIRTRFELMPEAESFDLDTTLVKQNASQVVGDELSAQKMVRPWALDRKPTARLLPSLAAPTPRQRPGLDRKHDLEK